MNTFFIRVMVLIMVADCDPFEMVIWIPIPASDRDAATTGGADLLDGAIKALLWEAIFCAAPHVNNVGVEVFAECSTHDATYYKEILKPKANFTVWTSELSKRVDEAATEIKADMKNMLTDLAAAHFDGTASGGGVSYAITSRD